MHQKMYDICHSERQNYRATKSYWWFRKLSKAVPKMSIDDWRYSDQKMIVREQALKDSVYQSLAEQMDGVVPKYSSQSIYECAQRLGISR